VRSSRKASVKAKCALVMALFFPAAAPACSIVYPTVSVGRTFLVHVQNEGSPVKPHRLALTRCANEACTSEKSDIRYSFTDTRGYARFDALPAGTYFLDPDRDDGISDAMYIKASPGGSDSLVVRVKWPGRAPIPVHSPSGTLRGPNYYPLREQISLSVSLLEGMSGKEIASTHTDDEGRFSFGDSVSPGMYFLRLNPSGLAAWSGEQIEGLIGIEISPKAQQADVDVDFGWSSCGLEYREQRKAPDIQTDQLCGAITDPAGAAISGANVWLLPAEAADRILGHTTSDPAGRFVLPTQLGGEYRLLVRSPGFEPFVAIIHLGQAAATSGQCRTPISVELDVL